MARLAVDLFAEDRAHEEFLKHLVRRIAKEEGCSTVPRVRSAQGGHGRALSELKIYQRLLLGAGPGIPDAIVVAIDANCQGWNQARNELLAVMEDDLRDRTVAACPDPHVERWYLADPESFAEVVGAAPRREQRKCERDRYKRLLREAVLRGNHLPTLGGLEFAQELVEAMDLYRAGQAEPSLGAFVDGCRALIRRVATDLE